MKQYIPLFKYNITSSDITIALLTIANYNHCKLKILRNVIDFNFKKMYPANHKTVFVLDHTPYFGISTESPLEFECLKGRGQNQIPLAPICKSLWTTSVESSMEYCRIVWDLFPSGKLVN